MIGEVNSVHKLDRYFHGMFGFLAVKEDDINVFADNPDSASLCGSISLTKGGPIRTEWGSNFTH